MTAPGGAVLRDPFACCVELRRFGVWHVAVGVLATAALAALVLWGWSVHSDAYPRAPWVAGAGALAVVAVALLLFRVDAGTLRRQAGGWTFAPLMAEAGVEPQAGELVVALDLGSFMLLVFTGAGGARRWLPAQRSGFGQEWQALRCAVHAPRSASPAAPAALE